jgi:alpha-beta hydrolase superfamily lysophospholipase
MPDKKMDKNNKKPLPFYDKIKTFNGPIWMAIYENPENEEWAIVVHGTMTNAECFNQLAMLFLSKGVNVALLHLTGHGRNRKKEVFDFEEMKENTKAAIHYVFRNYGKKVFLIGTSQGGFIVSAVAAESDKIKGVFAHGIMIPEWPESIYLTNLPKLVSKRYIEMIRGGLRLLARFFPKMKIPYRIYIDPKKIGSDRMVEIMDVMKYYPVKHVASLFNADMSGLKRIKCPIGVLMLEKETLFPAWYIRMIFEEIEAPKKELIKISSKTHSAFFEEPEKIVEAIVPKMREYALQPILPAFSQAIQLPAPAKNSGF